MERSSLIVIAVGLVAAALLFFVNPLLSLMVLIIAAALLGSLAIMRDTVDLPEIVAHLAEDAKGVVLENKGNAEAREVHAALIPLDLEFDVPPIPADGTHTLALPRMVDEVKTVVTYRNAKGQRFQQTALLSALHGEEDILRPPFALFRWK